MKILLDESLPKKLKTALPGHDVFTVREMRWTRQKNGLLIQLMVEQHFDVLITPDKGMQTQQNFSKYPLSLVVLEARSLRFEDLDPLMPTVLALLPTLKPGMIVVVRKPQVEPASPSEKPEADKNE